MSKTHWTALVALVGAAILVLSFGVGSFWILFGARGGMARSLCPWCGGLRGLLGSPRVVLVLGFFILLPLGLLLLLIAGLLWLNRGANGMGGPQPPA
jgi:hypothetical protein